VSACRQARARLRNGSCRGHISGKTQVVVDAEDGILGLQIAQGLDSVESEDQALNELLEEHFRLVVFRTM